MPTDDISDVNSHSVMMDWDKYDLHQFLHEPSESGVSVSNFLTKLGVNFNSERYRREQQKLQNSNSRLEITNAPLSHREAIRTQPRSKPNVKQTVVSRQKPKFSFMRILWCCGLYGSQTQNEYEEISICNTKEKPDRYSPDHLSLNSKNGNDGIWRNSNLALSEIHETLSVPSITHVTSTPEKTNYPRMVFNSSATNKKASECFECNESCCSFQHWKETNFYSLPSRSTPQIKDDVGTNPVGNLSDPLLSLKLPRGNELYSFTFDCHDSKTSTPLKKSFIPIPDDDECASSNCSIVKASRRLVDGHVIQNMYIRDSREDDPREAKHERILPKYDPIIENYNHKGGATLHKACIGGNDLIVRRLIKQNCLVDHQNELGNSALHEAARRGYSRCVSALINGNADIGLKNKKGDTALHVACERAHAGSLRLLLASCDCASPRNLQGDTPLHVSVRNGHVTCARVLLSARCAVDLQNKRGNTALHIATLSKHRKLIRILLDAGAKAEGIENDEGLTAVGVARSNGDEEIAIMLLCGPRQNLLEGKAKSRSRNVDYSRYNSEPRRRSKTEAFYSGDRGLEYYKRPKSATLPRKIGSRGRKIRRFKSHNKVDDVELDQYQITADQFNSKQAPSSFGDGEEDVVDYRSPPPNVDKVTDAMESTRGDILREIKKANQMLETRLDLIKCEAKFNAVKLDLITRERDNAGNTISEHRVQEGVSQSLVNRNGPDGIDQFRAPNEQENYLPDNSREGLLIKHSLRQTNKHSNASTQLMTHRNNAVSASSSQVFPDVTSLRPYQTIKIDRGHNSRSQTPPMYKRSWEPSWSPRTFDRNSNFSDSTFGSQPSQYGDTTSDDGHEIFHKMSRSFPTRSASNTFNRTNRGIPSPFRPLQRLNSGNIPGGEVSWKLEQQYFENFKEMMGEWYERRLQETAARQQKELSMKVAELEEKIKLLQSEKN